MKKLMLASAIAAITAAVTMAGQVYDRQTVEITDTGTAEWVNDVPYSALKLVRLWKLTSAVGTNTINVVRISADGLYTQTVASIAGPAPANSTAFSAGYLLPGDVLRFTASPATNGVIQVEYEVQQH